MSLGSRGVSVVMPVINEARHLADAVARILDQDWDGPLELIIALGPSSDRTDEVAQRLAASDARITLVANPSGRTPSGLNAAIGAASYDVIVRVDGHALIPADYVRQGVAVLERTGADTVGGIMAAEGSTDFERAVATAMTSWFGVGGASFHIGGDEGEAPTVYLGCFRRSALDRVGGYDETMIRAQDWEMNHRIRETGGLVWFTPQMKVTYRPRPTLKALSRQYVDYGRWRREVVRRHPSTLTLRYLAAPLTLIGLVAGVLLVVLGLASGHPAVALLGASAPVVYVLANLVASALTGRGLTWAARMRLPLVYVTMHMSWGAGFIRGGAMATR